MFGLRAALDMLFAEGLEASFKRHRLLAEATRRAVGVWAEGGTIGHSIAAPREHRHGDDRADARRPEPAAACSVLPHAIHVVLGVGLGPLSGQAFPHRAYGPRQRADGARHLERHQLGLAALGMAHGRGGAQAAVEYLGAALAAGHGADNQRGGEVGFFSASLIF